MKKRNLVTEAHIETACTQMLQLDGWWTLKLEQNYSEKKRKVVGEAGMADRLYIRFEYFPEFATDYRRAVAEVLFVEWKRPKGEVRDNQLRWRARLLKLGAMYLLSGMDFDSTIEDFRRWYKTSGLMRHQILS